jgi:hypothetical protein
VEQRVELSVLSLKTLVVCGTGIQASYTSVCIYCISIPTTMFPEVLGRKEGTRSNPFRNSPSRPTHPLSLAQKFPASHLLLSSLPHTLFSIPSMVYRRAWSFFSCTVNPCSPLFSRSRKIRLSILPVPLFGMMSMNSTSHKALYLTFFSLTYAINR